MTFTTTRRGFQSPDGWNQSQLNLTRLDKRMYVSGPGFTYSSGDTGGSGSGSSGWLHTNAIIGIVVGCLAVLGLIMVFMIRRSRERITETLKRIFSHTSTERPPRQPRGGGTNPPNPPGAGTNQTHGNGPSNPPQQAGSQNAPHQPAGGVPGHQTAGNAAH